MKPGVVHVFDHFHVIKLFNDKLSALRRELYNQASCERGKEILKGTRWLLLKITQEPRERRPQRTTERLDRALALNLPLTTAYYLKEQLAEAWEQADEAEARLFLLDWIAQAETSGVRMLHKFAQTLRAHAWGILAWYDHPISTGPLEGTNNKIKTLGSSGT